MKTQIGEQTRRAEDETVAWSLEAGVPACSVVSTECLPSRKMSTPALYWAVSTLIQAHGDDSE